MKKILILAGGTGGHIMPALNLASHFREHFSTVEWCGRTNSLEEKIAKTAGFNFHSIRITALRGSSVLNWLKFPFLLTKAIIDSIAIVKKVNPDVIIGTGGYVCFAGYIAGFLLRKKVCIQEQNTIMGLSNKLASYFVNRVFLPLPVDNHQFATDTGEVLAIAKTSSKFVNVGGNPINPTLNYLPKKENDYTQLNLLILGGSLGASYINEVIPQVISKMSHLSERINVIHQTGERDYMRTKSLYEKLGVNIRTLEIKPFITDMPRYYDWANFLIARSGAMTISEITAVGLPALLIPYPFATDDHQYHNAMPLLDANLAYVIRQNNCKLENIVEILTNILTNAKINLEIKQTKNIATQIIYDEILTLL